MVDTPNLLRFRLNNPYWDYLDSTGPERKERIIAIANLVKQLQSATDSDRYAYTDIMLQTEKIVPDEFMPEHPEGKLPVDEHNGVYVGDVFSFWLEVVIAGADMALQEQKARTPKGGQKPQLQRKRLLHAVALYYREFVGEMPTSSNSYSQRTTFSKIAHAVLEKLGFIASGVEVEHAIAEAVKDIKETGN
jgi:hypothetical protein